MWIYTTSKDKANATKKVTMIVDKISRTWTDITNSVTWEEGKRLQSFGE